MGTPDKLIVVSSDSHAGVPHELWSQYLSPEYHDLLPALEEDNTIYPTVIWLLTAQVMKRPDLYEAHHTGGYRGLFDSQVRLQEMDREGVAAELIYHGDFRCGDMFHNITNKKYPLGAWEAGAKGWNRWASDTFGFATDRFLLIGAVGPCVDMDATRAELSWISDHGFTGTYAPGFLRHADMPPLYDEYWDPFWSECEERGLAVVVHAGYGWEQGVPFAEFERIYRDVTTAVGSTDLEVLKQHPEALHKGLFDGSFFADIKPRRPMWQLMLGGVFDRHPDLKVCLTEIRADWIPATLHHLDAVYDKNRSELSAKRTPSEYWHDNFLVGASFIHKSEVEIRHEIDIETISFGRDYPHPESTWPHTRQWLRDAFADVPVDEVALILGENAIRFLGLDRAHLAEIANRIGFTMDELIAETPQVPPDLIDSWDLRSGYLKPIEGAARLDAIEEPLHDDLAAVGAGA